MLYINILPISANLDNDAIETIIQFCSRLQTRTLTVCATVSFLFKILIDQVCSIQCTPTDVIGNFVPVFTRDVSFRFSVHIYLDLFNNFMPIFHKYSSALIISRRLLKPLINCCFSRSRRFSLSSLSGYLIH